MPDNRKPLMYGAFPVCRNYTVRAFKHDLQAKTQSRRYKSNAGRYGTRTGRYDYKSIRTYSGRGRKSSGKHHHESAQPQGKRKSPESAYLRGFWAFPPGFEPGAFRLGATPRRFCSVMHNVKKSEKSPYYSVFQ